MDQTRAALREMADGLYRSAVRAALPGPAVARILQSDPSVIAGPGKVHVLAVGKAGAHMMRAALEQLPGERLGRAMVVTIPGNDLPLSGVTFHLAAHPVPDMAGLKAAIEVEHFVDGLKAEDVLLCLISGGGSALLPAPLAGLTLEDKAMVNALLLQSGADIRQMNVVRQSLSRLKGGGLLRRASPARVVSLILSDVIGDDLSVVASGPTIGPIGTAVDACAVLKELDLWSRLPRAVRRVLSNPAKLPPVPNAIAHLIGSNGQSLNAMLAQAPRGAVIVDGHLTSSVKDAAHLIVQQALVRPDASALIFGGETTVHVTGPGLGGRNQELSLRVAQEAARQGLPGPWAFLSGGTDGRDGPTDAAGGCTDDTTLARFEAAGGDVEAVLANNDSFHALTRIGDAIPAWNTGTNVADVQIMLRPAALQNPATNSRGLVKPDIIIAPSETGNTYNEKVN